MRPAAVTMKFFPKIVVLLFALILTTIPDHHLCRSLSPFGSGFFRALAKYRYQYKALIGSRGRTVIDKNDSTQQIDWANIDRWLCWRHAT
jgi:hypothetical protein